MECAKLLREQPYLGKIEPLLEDRDEKYRSLVVGRLHKLIYTIKEENIVFIQLFWDCRQDPEKLKKAFDDI